MGAPDSTLRGNPPADRHDFDAYLLASVAVDLRISQIVDIPKVIVTAHCPLSILEPTST